MLRAPLFDPRPFVLNPVVDRFLVALFGLPHRQGPGVLG
jgi:hypothetical protein